MKQSSHDAIIEIKDLSFAFREQRILDHINIKIRAGDFVAMIGPNGGGKTTLLKLMLGILETEKGLIRIFGKIPRLVSHRVGYVPQDVHINTHFPISVLDVVLMGRIKPGRRMFRASNTDRTAAQRALKQMEMDAYCARRIGELSGGQRQRVFIARALVSDPDLLFLDEPFASVDTRSQAGIYTLLEDLNCKMTILMVSHDLMFISSYVKSVVCVNRSVHYHDQPEITDEMAAMCNCPVELIAHGLPHRVLEEH